MEEYPIRFYLLGGNGADKMLKATKETPGVVVDCDKVGLYIDMSHEVFGDLHGNFLKLRGGDGNGNGLS